MTFELREFAAATTVRNACKFRFMPSAFLSADVCTSASRK